MRSTDLIQRRRTSTRRWHLLALVMALGLVVAACGGSSDGNDGATSETTIGAGSTPAEPSSQDPVPGGDLVIGIQAETDG